MKALSKSRFKQGLEIFVYIIMFVLLGTSIVNINF